MIITFFGHARLSNQKKLLGKVKETILAYVKKDEKISFYCGEHGDFDRLCLQACHELSGFFYEIVCVTPYLTECEQRKLQEGIRQRRYDAIVYPPLENKPPRLAILFRNRWMIENADLVIVYVEHSYGGAYQALEYARKCNKAVINLAKTDKNKI